MKPIVYLFFLVIVFDTYGFPAKPGPFHKSKSMDVPSKKGRVEVLKKESIFNQRERKGEAQFNKKRQWNHLESSKKTLKTDPICNEVLL